MFTKRCCATCDFCIEFKDMFNCCAEPLCGKGPTEIPQYLLNTYYCVNYSNDYECKIYKGDAALKPLLEDSNNEG